MRPAAVIPAALAAALAMPGCDAQIRRDAAEGVTNVGAEAEDRGGRALAAQRAGVVRVDTPWYGAAVEPPVSVSGQPLPDAVEGPRGLTLSRPGQAGVGELAEAVTATTGIPVNVRTRYITDDGVVEVPIGTRMRARHEGPLSAFLDRMAARMDIAWSHDGRVITLDRMVRRSWGLPLPLGATAVADGVSPEGSASVSVERRIDAWQEVEAQLLRVAPPPAQVTVSPLLGRVEVFGPPSVQRAAESVIRDAVTAATTRIGIEVAVYFVDTDRSDTFGLGIKAVKDLGNNSLSTVSMPAIATSGAGTFTLSRGASNQVDFRALAKDSSVVDYRLGSSLAQSGTVSPIVLTRAQNFVSGRTVTKSDTGVAEEIATETVETGITITALPRLVGRGRIQLSLSLDQRSLVSLDSFGTGNNQVQLPKVDTRRVRSDTVLAPGETLVLSGYEQDFAELSDSGIGALRRIGLGGKVAGERRKVRMVVLVRPSLVPAGSGT